MKKFFLFLVALLFFKFTALPQEIIISTFDNDNEGWTNEGGPGQLYYHPTGGNPDGFIEFEDLGAGTGTLVAPAKFLGDLTAYKTGTFSFDLKNTVSNGQHILITYGTIRIMSEEDTVFHRDIVDTVYLPEWTSFSVPFTADEWGVTTQEWDSLLSNVVDIRILIDPQPYHQDRAGLDNFSISPFASDVENEEDEYLPMNFELRQNYPNPFNPSTKIKYSIPQSSNVVIKVFDILGSEIETIVNEEKPVGTYEITWHAEGLPSGVYFYQLKVGDFIETKKMILLK
jgi:hypothetical protein